MSCHLSPRVATSGLVLSLDAKNPKSYSGSGNTWSSLVKGYNVALNTGGSTPTFSNGTFQYRNGSNTYSTVTFDEGVLKPANEAGAWSIEVLFKYVSAPPINESIIVGRAGCHGGIYVGTTHVLYHAIKTTAAGNCWTGAINSVVGVLTPGQTYHTVFTYNNGACAHYLNGDAGSTATSTFDTVTYDITSYNNTLLIGGLTGGFFPNVDIAAVRCYNRALTAEEVKRNYIAGQQRVL